MHALRRTSACCGGVCVRVDTFTTPPHLCRQILHTPTRTSTHASPLFPEIILYGTISASFFVCGSSYRRPIRRLVAYTVLAELVTACWLGCTGENVQRMSSCSCTVHVIINTPSSIHLINTNHQYTSSIQHTWRLAGNPTNRSPLSVNATTEGVVRPPSAFSITLAFCDYDDYGALMMMDDDT